MWPGQPDELMKFYLRAITEKDQPVEEEFFLDVLQKGRGFADHRTLEFRDYYKMPGHQVIGIEFEIEAKNFDSVFEAVGSQPTWRNDSAVIYDTKQGASIRWDVFTWMHLEVL